MTDISTPCHVCDKGGVLCCAKCKKVRYCGKECQKIDWTFHKTLCAAPGGPHPKILGDMSFREYATMAQKICLFDSKAWKESWEGYNKQGVYMTIVDGWKMKGMMKIMNFEEYTEGTMKDRLDLFMKKRVQPLVQRPIPIDEFKIWLTLATHPRSSAWLPRWWDNAVDNPGTVKFFEDRIEKGLEEKTTVMDLSERYGETSRVGSISVAGSGVCTCAGCVGKARRF